MKKTLRTDGNVQKKTMKDNNYPMLSQYRVDQRIISEKHTMRTLDNQISKHSQEIYKYNRKHKIHEEKAITVKKEE